MKSTEELAKEIQSNIREVLFNEWDPIGIKKDGLTNEYDAYIGRVYGLLSSKTSEDELVGLLHKIEIDEMGINSCNKKLHSVARKLLMINVSINSAS